MQEQLADQTNQHQLTHPNAYMLAHQAAEYGTVASAAETHPAMAEHAERMGTIAARQAFETPTEPVTASSHLDSIAERGHADVAKQLRDRLGSLSVQAERSEAPARPYGEAVEHIGIWDVSQPHVHKVLGDIASATNAAHERLQACDAKENTNAAEDPEAVWQDAVGLLETYAITSAEQLKTAKAGGGAAESETARAGAAMESYLAAATIERGTEIAAAAGMREDGPRPSQERITNLARKGYALEVVRGIQSLDDKRIIAPVKVMDYDTFQTDVRPVLADSLLTDTMQSATELAFPKELGKPAEIDPGKSGPDALYLAYDIATAAKHTERSHELAPVVLAESVSTKDSFGSSNQDGRLHAVEQLVTNNGEVFAGDGWHQLAQKTRVSREVGGEYRNSNGRNSELDTLIVRGLVHPDQRVQDVAKSLLSDKPDGERANLGFAVQYSEGLDSAAVEIAVEVATINEQQAVQMRIELLQESAPGSTLLTAATLQGEVWDEAPDRRLLVQATANVNQVLSNPELSDSVREQAAVRLSSVLRNTGISGPELFTGIAIKPGNIEAIATSMQSVAELGFDADAQARALVYLNISSPEKVAEFNAKVAEVTSHAGVMHAISANGLLAEQKNQIIDDLFSDNRSTQAIQKIEGLLADSDTMSIIGDGGTYQFLRSKYVKEFMSDSGADATPKLQALAAELAQHPAVAEAVSEHGMVQKYAGRVAEKLFHDEYSGRTIAAIESLAADTETSALIAEGSPYAFMADAYVKQHVVDLDPNAQENLRAVTSNGFTSELLQDSELGDTVRADLALHFTSWAEAVKDVKSEPDKLVEHYIRSRLTLAAAGKPTESPVVTMQALEAFELPALEDAMVDAIKQVIDKPTLRPIPTKESRYKGAFAEDAYAKLYGSVLKLKAESPDATAEEYIASLIQRGAVDQAMADRLRAADPGDKDASSLIANLRVVREKHAARADWLKDGAPATGMVTPHVVVTWKNRAAALRERGIADDPRSIMPWVRKKAYGNHIQERRARGEADLPSDEELAAYAPVIQELAVSYDLNKKDTIPALQRYIALDKAGKLEDTQITPGTVIVSQEVPGKEEGSTENRKYSVEVLSKKDPRIFSMGVDTGCCMTLGGASEACIWQALEDPAYGGMIVSSGGRVRAQSVMYMNESAPDALVLDSIEANKGTDMTRMTEVYRTGLDQLLQQGKLNQDVRRVQVGKVWTEATYKTNAGYLEVVDAIPGPDGLYTDAQEQRLLLKR